MSYSLEEIETFLTVMELETATAAAARLNISKSVVSKRIADFEQTIGVALFHRNAGRIIPTDAAIDLSERLRPALSELKAAAESASVSADKTLLRGRLAIAAPTSLGTLFLGPIIARFAAAHPNLDIYVDYDDRYRDLMREGFDIAIRVGTIRDAALKSRKLCEDRLVACASPTYLARYGTPQSVADLAQHSVIGYVHLSNAQLWQFKVGDRFVAPVVKGRLTTNNAEAMRDLALGGLALAMLPRFVAAVSLANGSLVEILPTLATQSLPVLAVWPPVSPVPAKLRAFIDHMVESLGGNDPWYAP